MARVLLISPPTPWDAYLVQSELYPNGALVQLGAILKKAGHAVKVIHMLADRVTFEKLPDEIHLFQPDMVGITMVTFQAKTGRRVSEIVKSISKDIKVVAGGPHVSAVWRDASLRMPCVDVQIVGEGDEAILRVANSEDVGSIHLAPFITDLDVLPMPDYSLVNLKAFSGIYPPGPMPSLNIQGSRGCPFKCSFCSKSVFGTNVRYRSPASVVEEIDYMVKKWHAREFFFQDDTFDCNRKWVDELLELIIRRGLNKHIVYRARCRANEKLVDKPLLALMKAAGFWLVFYGVENGNQAMLDRMGKALKVEEIKRAFKLTRDAGIKTEASFIIGLPGETADTICDSVYLWRELKPDWCSFSRLIPFPGTRVEQELRNNNHLLVPDCENLELNKTQVRTEAMSADELEQAAQDIDAMVARSKLTGLARHPGELLRVAADGLRNPGGMARAVRRAWEVVSR